MILHLRCCPTLSDQTPLDDFEHLFGALLPNPVLSGKCDPLK
jgi:hypothetical protein